MAVNGAFRQDLISEAFDLLVRRHEVLRTTFVMVDEKLRQRVHEPTLAPSFESLDLSGLDPSEQDERIRIALLREDDWHFDLSSGPLVRAFVADRGNDQWVLAVTLAHLIVDGWSGGVLQREFQELYSALLRGEHRELPTLPLQYGDYAVSEEQWLQTANVGDRVQFWRERLDGKLAALDLPTDAALPQTSKANGAVELAPLDVSVGTSVRQLARDLETTPFVIYGAVFQALLFRYSGETDITFSTPLASRNDETENVIGPFSTPVPLRSRLQPDWSIRQYIQALHNTAMDTFDNPLPFEKYADMIALSTVRGRHALNQLCFFYQKAFVESSEIDGLRFTALPTTVTGAGFEWQLAIIERIHDVITAELQYDADQYCAATIQTVLRHYERLLSEAMFHLDTPVRNLAFATSEELAAAASHPDSLPPVSKRAVGIDGAPRPEAAAAASATLPDVFPRNEAEAKMAGMWEKAFRRSPISVHANFFDLGGHSLTFARLQTYCQQQIGKRIYAADLFAAPTIATLTARLEGAGADIAFNPRLIPLQPVGSQPPIFLISQSMIFRRVAESLGPDQPVFSVQIEDEDLTGTETFEDFARFYVKIIRQVRPHGPYRVGGWCAAGWIAYEIAQQLRALGETVDMLLIVDAWAPGYWRDLPPVRKLIAKTSYYWARFNFHRRTVVALSSRERKDFFKERFRLWKAAVTRQMGSIPFLRMSPQTVTENDTTLVDQVQYAAGLKYHARPWPGGALLFCSSEQPFGSFLPRDMGWGQMLTEQSDVTVLPGDHHKIFDDPGAAIVAAKVKAAVSGESTPAHSPSVSRPPVVIEGDSGDKNCALAGF
jgi:thioesterase domain-containing protein